MSKDWDLRAPWHVEHATLSFGLAGQTGFTQFIFDMKTDCKEQLEHMVTLGHQD